MRYVLILVLVLVVTVAFAIITEPPEPPEPSCAGFWQEGVCLI